MQTIADVAEGSGFTPIEIAVAVLAIGLAVNAGYILSVLAG
jgi:hypothetical protein